MNVLVLIGAGKLAVQFYKQYSRHYHIRVVGTNFRQFKEFEGLKVSDAYIADETSGICPEAFKEADCVVCAVAPSVDRVRKETQEGKSINDVFHDTYYPISILLSTELLSHPSVKQVVWCSCVSVYGNHQGEPVDEESSLNPPKDHSSRSLIEAEHNLCGLSYQGVKTTILRFGYLYSPQRSLFHFYDVYQESVEATYWQKSLNLTHYEDAAGSVNFCLRHEVIGTYNVVNELNLLSTIGLIDRIATTFGMPLLDEYRNVYETSTYPFVVDCRVMSDAIKERGFLFVHPDTVI